NFNSSESQNISKPPFFYGNIYSHWKAKMTIFIQYLDYNLWDLIVDGPNLPTITNENGEIISKPRNKYNDDDRKIVQLNAKAKHVIICAINSNEFKRVSSYVSAKEMCDRLEVTYEGEPSKIEEIICYECNKPGHYKSDCPRLKKKEQGKKKAMIATWEDSDDSSSEEEGNEEVAQLALMAIEEEED
ncbi:LOW QUALITY PROTEIN: zf-CCHC domain-containing protein, partial [Cephalotus follicularis]